MLELYSWRTPNGRKPVILLEEIGVEYDLRPIDLRKGDQRTPEFLAISANGKIPALRDPEAEGGSVTIFESAAILQYIAEKYDSPFGGRTLAEKGVIWQWTYWQMSAIGPTFGQLYHFNGRKADMPDAYERFRAEAERLMGVLSSQLEQHDYVAGEYSIADMSLYAWVALMMPLFRKEKMFDLGQFDRVQPYLDRVAERPAVKTAMNLFSDL